MATLTGRFGQNNYTDKRMTIFPINSAENAGKGRAAQQVINYIQNNIDVILTVSQLKLWNSYSSCEEYALACEKNKIGWGVSRVNLQHEKDTFYTSYQLLQVLDLTQEQIENMCRPTVS